MTLDEHQDQYTMFHDKPKGSNNRGIYTAFAKYLTPELLDFEVISQCYLEISKNSTDSRYIVHRNPDKNIPPQSKDEVLGWTSLGYYDFNRLQKQHYNFYDNSNFKPKPLYLLNWFKVISQFKELNVSWRHSES